MKLQLVSAVLPGGLVVVSVYLSNRQLRAEHCVFEHAGQVLRSMGLPFIVGGVFNLAGDVLEQSGWLHAVRARIAAPNNDTPTCFDSTVPTAEPLGRCGEHSSGRGSLAVEAHCGNGGPRTA